MSKLTYEFVKSQFVLRGYNLLDTEYVNAHLKMKYQCLKHPEVIQEINYNNLKNGRGCAVCGGNYRIKTIEQANLLIKTKHTICIKYGGNLKNKSLFRCLIDGYEWETSLECVLNSKFGCPKCANLAKITSIDQVNDILKEQNKNIVCIYYIGNTYKHDSRFKCLIDGNEWTTSVNNIINLNRGCAKCSNLKRITSIDEVNKYLLDNNIPIKCISYVGNVIGKSVFKCLNDGYIWESTFNNIKNGNRCPKCSSSKGEDAILKFLSNYNIDHIYQYIDNRCRDKSVLPFDFYLPEYNLCIEYQGEQHYFPVDFASKGQKWAKERFEYNKFHDKIKKEFCLTNNIDLLEIPYWEYKNINSIILNKLKERRFNAENNSNYRRSVEVM